MKSNQITNPKQKATIMSKNLLFVCLLWALTLTTTSAAPLGTAFTYSGRLKYQNQPANGNFDLEIKLYDAANGGNQAGQLITVNGLSIVDGLFVASLDFGGGVFNGTAYWLDIAARPSGNGPFTPLSPRQPVNPSPYALYALTPAGPQGPKGDKGDKGDQGLQGPKGDKGDTGATGLQGPKGDTGATGLTGPKGDKGDKGDQGLQGLQGLQGMQGPKGDKGDQGDPGVPGPKGDKGDKGDPGPQGLPGSADAWSLTGNANTTPGVNFLGTTDNQPLELWANNARGLRLEYTGSYNPVTRQGSSSFNVIGGYHGNQVINGALGATIAGGGYSQSGLLGGDYPNQVGAGYGAIGGGAGNSVLGLYGTVPGGHNNQANGAGSFAVGQNNEANGDGSFAAGRGAHANHDGSFVWGDGTGGAFSTAVGSWDVLATGGVNFHTGANPLTLHGPWLVATGLGDEQAYFGGDGAGGDVQIGSLNPNIANVALYNAGNNTWMNLLARDATVRTLTITGGADLAEPFQVSENEIPKGSVVIIDTEHPGKLKLSGKPYDTRVAGVISGAGGVQPGIQMKQKEVLEGTENVALTGRVYVLADASQAAITPGDLLTTSTTPGHAMKVTDHSRAQGAILGKAMSALAEGRGMVLLLVTLQ